MIIRDHYPQPPQDPGQTQSGRAAQRRAEETEDAHRTPEPRRSEQDGAKNLHKTDDLRRGVEELVDSGDVRPNRVEEARQNRDDGLYDRPSVLSEVVDRLLDQWRIV